MSAPNQNVSSSTADDVAGKAALSVEDDVVTSLPGMPKKNKQAIFLDVDRGSHPRGEGEDIIDGVDRPHMKKQANNSHAIACDEELGRILISVAPCAPKG